MADQNGASRGVWSFFLLTYAITILTWGTMIALGIPGASAGSSGSPASPTGVLLLFLGGFAPSIAGVIMTALVRGRAGLADLWQHTMRVRFGARWYLEILALPFVAFVVRIAVQLLRGLDVQKPTALGGVGVLIGFTITIILGGAVAEEFGWRGFALYSLLSRNGVWNATLALGLFWLFWHLPLFFIRGTVQAAHDNFFPEFAVFALWILSLAVLFTWIYIGTGRSLFAALLFHAAVDWFGTLAGTAVPNGGITDRLVNALVYAVLAGIVLLTWKHPRRSP